MSGQKRKYELRARAKTQKQTRDRIVAATMALHRKVGPAKTTVAEIARLARVQRLTVYNHFPALADLLGACQGHFLALHPPPDVMPAGPRAKAARRLESALTEMYGWYRTNEGMERHIHGDRHLVPELDTLLRQTLDPALDATADAYAMQFGESARPLIRVAFEFRTWQLLTGQGLQDRQIARVFARASSRPA